MQHLRCDTQHPSPTGIALRRIGEGSIVVDEPDQIYPILVFTKGFSKLRYAQQALLAGSTAVCTAHTD